MHGASLPIDQRVDQHQSSLALARRKHTHKDTRRVYWRVTSNHLQQIAYSF